MLSGLSIASPQAPRSFQLHARKEGEPGKTYHVRDVRWNQLPYMAQQQVGQDQAGQDQAESPSSSISTLQSAMNQQEETLQHLRYVSKTAICMVTQQWRRKMFLSRGAESKQVKTCFTRV